MAILWQKTINKNRYEVRSAGQTRRLYTNGVCHSEFNPTSITTGSIWDLLLIPVFFHPVEQVKRILVLGVGGGSVIQQMLALLQPEKIVGVELNPTHLYITKRFFQLDHPTVELIEADAIEWLHQYQGPPFDFIIEDLFLEVKKDPVRVIEADPPWFRVLMRNLGENGKLVMNFISTDEIKQSGYFTDDKISRQFKSTFQLTVPSLDNVVGVFLKEEGDSAVLRKNLNAILDFRKALASKKLTYRIRKLNRT